MEATIPRSDPTSTPEGQTLRQLVETIWEPATHTRTLAEKAYAAADEDQRKEAALEAFADVARKIASGWGERRSGHQNQSGRLRALASSPGGILNEQVHTNDGSAYLLRDVTITIAAKLMAEYGDRARSAISGRSFWKAVHEAMRQMNAVTVADLGEERLEALRQKHKYRD